MMVQFPTMVMVTPRQLDDLNRVIEAQHAELTMLRGLTGELMEHLHEDVSAEALLELLQRYGVVVPIGPGHSRVTPVGVNCRNESTVRGFAAVQ